jgi:hypothetical protein
MPTLSMLSGDDQEPPEYMRTLPLPSTATQMFAEAHETAPKSPLLGSITVGGDHSLDGPIAGEAVVGDERPPANVAEVRASIRRKAADRRRGVGRSILAPQGFELGQAKLA